MRFGLGVLCVAALPAFAQEEEPSWVTLPEERGPGAEICEAEGDCLELSCHNAPLALTLRSDASGGTATITVDVMSLGTFIMSQNGEGFAAIEIEPALHDPLIEAMRAGGSVALTLGEQTHAFSLAGSRDAINTVLFECGAIPAIERRAQTTLSADQVRAELLGLMVRFGEETYRFYPDGTVESGEDEASYLLRDDGRLCISGDSAVCFLFYRDGGAINVRREEGQTGVSLGPVVFN